MTKTGLALGQNRTWRQLKQYLAKTKTGLRREQISTYKKKRATNRGKPPGSFGVSNNQLS